MSPYVYNYFNIITLLKSQCINMLFKVRYYVNFREYIVDLMSDPGTLIPSDAAGSHVEYDDSFFTASTLSREIGSSYIASSSNGGVSPYLSATGNESDDRRELTACANLPRPSNDSFKAEKTLIQALPSRPSHPLHGRSPSWTEGVSSPAVRRMKVKDVSQYMIDAAKENPQLAQKLHDVLLESGVVAPRNLFTEIYPEQLDVQILETKFLTEDKDGNEKRPVIQKIKDQDDPGPIGLLPPLPHHGIQPRASPSAPPDLKHVEGLWFNNLLEFKDVTGQSVSSQSEVTHSKYAKNVPVAAAAAAAAAVVASSMVVAAAKSTTDPNLELPVAAAATAAAAVVATTAAVGKHCENLETGFHSPSAAGECFNQSDGTQSGGEADGPGRELRGSGDREHDTSGTNPEGERTSDTSAGSSKSDVALDDVADCEIPWDEIALGDRIGLGIGLCIVSLEFMNFNFFFFFNRL